MNDISNYKTYCEDLYNSYNIKHYEFLKYYIAITQLFKILQQLEDNNPIDYQELLSNWNLDISDKIAIQTELYQRIEKLKGEFKGIISKKD